MLLVIRKTIHGETIKLTRTHLDKELLVQTLQVLLILKTSRRSIHLILRVLVKISHLAQVKQVQVFRAIIKTIMFLVVQVISLETHRIHLATPNKIILEILTQMHLATPSQTLLEIIKLIMVLLLSGISLVLQQEIQHLETLIVLVIISSLKSLNLHSVKHKAPWDNLELIKPIKINNSLDRLTMLLETIIKLIPLTRINSDK